MKRELDKSEKYATGRIRMKSTGGNKLRELFFIRRDDLTDKKDEDLTQTTGIRGDENKT